MFSEGDLGVLPPLGVYDPLGLIETRDMRRYEIMEIKHGRAAMLGFLHVIALKAGIVLPGDLSPSLGIKFSDVPTTCFGSLEAVPTFGWLQIMLFTCMQETGASPLAEAQTDDKEAGDIAIDSWVRYDDPETKTFKLNAERQNGRAPGHLLGSLSLPAPLTMPRRWEDVPDGRGGVRCLWKYGPCSCVKNVER